METNCRKLVSACVQLGVQPSAVECLFSKDSEIKKVEFNDSPENRKEVATSKLFTRQHPNANEFSISTMNIFTFLGYLIKQWGNKMVQ